MGNETKQAEDDARAEAKFRKAEAQRAEDKRLTPANPDPLERFATAVERLAEAYEAESELRARIAKRTLADMDLEAELKVEVRREYAEMKAALRAEAERVRAKIDPPGQN